MPIYEFMCEQCGHEFEQILSFSASSYPACPSCEADAVKRRMSKPAIHFKGSGWYITDSKSDTKKSNGTNGHESTAKEEKTEGAKSEASSETTTAKSEPAKAETVKSES